MSHPSNASHLHPACGYHCTKCTDRIIYTQTEARTLYCMAVEETEPNEIFQAHLLYLDDPSLRAFGVEIPHKTCRTCGKMLVIDMFSPDKSHKFIRACRITDEAGDYLDSWDAKMSTNLEKMIASLFFSEIGNWWSTDLPCLRASLNTAWRAGISGISMIILSSMFEARFTEELEKECQLALQQDVPQGIVIPPIIIPVHKSRKSRHHVKQVTPTSSNFWDGLSEKTIITLCEPVHDYDWDVIDREWFHEHKHLIA